MKDFRNYIIHNCPCIATKYDNYFSIYPAIINYKLLQEISQLFDLDEIMLLENQLFK